MSCHLYSKSWSTYNTWRMFADLWRVGRSCLGEKELRAGPMALAVRTYTGWLLGRGWGGAGSPLPHLPPAPSPFGGSHSLFPDLVSCWLSPVLLTS